MVVLENKIYVYNFQTLTDKEKQCEKFETTPNPLGIIAMNGSKDMCVLAAPDVTEGSIRVIHFDQAKKTVNITGHLSPVTAIALNHDGNLVATASQKGQMIRIFISETGQQIQELRRGMDSAEIMCLNFDPVSKFIGCTSDKGTIHVFSIRHDVSLAAMTHMQLEELQTAQNQVPSNAGAVQNLQPITPLYYPPEGVSKNPKSLFSFMKVLFPRYFSSEWSFAQFRVQDMHSLCAIRDKYVIGISKDGNYYVAEIDMDLGGECKMI